MQWSFTKYVGCGNDFILFDNRNGKFPFSIPLIQQLCHRQWGVGADGIILLENSTIAHARMRIFNADGSEAEMCGNGLRCLIDWMESLNILHSIYSIETNNHVLKAWKSASNITIEMGSPNKLNWNVPISFESKIYYVHSLNTGVPHIILFAENIEQFPLERMGPFIRYHPLWKPDGTNFSIVQHLHGQTFMIRTYERGVEAETLACGTGATAAALAAAFQYRLSAPISMQTRSGICLEIGFTLLNQKFTNVTMTGPALAVFNGSIKLES
ncbi:diaminopimelate epimerase [Candidatus Protochlamydia amoebophila]|jgi:diaminopimelate epimerase|uniref:Diaminopimelate epimerase n=2 Tax=Candidatus Protochlamydia amoebophila TaxID=362787 RepID=Q6ME33_PARUW|nr:diaminopimelate epimerase [Candidatus Protochlamydia amoebophila]CAF23166.1 unnamed protein product [Candidatus Protochlamydia amoebophila UWE25]